MTVERINPPTLLPPAENAYAHITRSTGSVSYRISGQVAVDVDGSDLCVDDIEGQTRACYESIGRALSHIKLGWSDVTHLLTFTTDIAAYSQIEAKVIAELFGEHPPQQPWFKLRNCSAQRGSLRFRQMRSAGIRRTPSPVMDFCAAAVTTTGK